MNNLLANNIAGVAGGIPLVPPQLLFMLINPLNQCIARLQHTFNVVLTNHDQAVLEHLMTQFAVSYNLTLLTHGECNFFNAPLDSMSLEFCGDTDHYAYNGDLTADVIRGALNTTELLELMTSATHRDCDLDSVHALLIRIGVIIAFLLLLLVGASCYEGYERLNTSARRFENLDHQPTLFRASTSRDQAATRGITDTLSKRTDIPL